MSKERIFKELINQMAKDGEISSSQYEILIEKGKDLGIDTESVDLLIKLELADLGYRSFDNSFNERKTKNRDDIEHHFRSAITRGGSILTPDRIVITNDTITYKKRNKHLINVDSLTIPIAKISSVELDTSILGTDIVITSFGTGKIVCKKFSKSDAKKIRGLIQERQGR